MSAVIFNNGLVHNGKLMDNRFVLNNHKCMMTTVEKSRFSHFD